MIREGLEQGIVTIAAGGIGAGAAALRLMLMASYGKMVRASNSMASVKKKWLKQLKMKFETMYQLDIGVHNVDIFVNKHVNQRKILGITTSAWEAISGQAMLLCGLSAAGAVLFGIYYDCGQDVILSTAIAGIGGIGLVKFVDNMSGLTAKKLQLQRNLIDYFENYSKVRLEKEMEQRLQTTEHRTQIVSQLDNEASNPAEQAAVADETEVVATKRQMRKARKEYKKEEKLRMKEEVRECKQRQKEEREEVRARIKDGQLQSKQTKDKKVPLQSSELTEEVMQRREAKRQERRQRTIEEFGLAAKEAATAREGILPQEIKETERTENQEMEVSAADEKKESQRVSAAQTAGIMMEAVSSFAGNTNMMDKPLDALGDDPQLVKDLNKGTEESVAGEQAAALSSADDIIKGLRLDRSAEAKRQRTKKEEKLIEEVLKEFLA